MLTHYQIGYHENGIGTFDAYCLDKHIGTWTHELSVPFQDALADVCARVANGTPARFYLHSHPESPKSQQRLEELARELGRAPIINGMRFWIGGPLSSMPQCRGQRNT